MRAMRAELERAQSGQLSGVQASLEAVRNELRATRDATEEEQRRVRAAQLLVM